MNSRERRLSSEEREREREHGWSETPCIHVYTHKGWDRWRKRTRALRNTRPAFCRAASAFIKESLAPSLSFGILLFSSSLSLRFLLPRPPPSSFFLLILILVLVLLWTNERILAHRFFVLSSRCSSSSLASFHLYNFPCHSLCLSLFLFLCLSCLAWKIETVGCSSGIFARQDIAEGQFSVPVIECFNLLRVTLSSTSRRNEILALIPSFRRG